MYSPFSETQNPIQWSGMIHSILGTDEAGYGPNLGPLVISCVIWKMEENGIEDAQPADDPIVELERRLRPIVTDSPSQWGNSGKLLLIGDSKKLYQSGKLQILANAVQTAVDFSGHSPLNTDHSYGVSLCDIKSEVISPRDFNRLLEQLGNKSTLLTETTLQLIKNAIQTLPDGGDVTILCDKHGGRNRYADQLYRFFPDGGWIEILTEGTPLSVYRLCSQGRKIEFRFQAKADRHIPAALASMTAKLLRELAMLEFNRFWQQYLPDLQPTAGYPVDATRFFGQIDEIRQKLGIPKSDIWREK
jgi:ribonuclease HII